MKKYLSVILGIILTACLVACGSSNKDSVNDDKQEVRLGKMNMPEREVVELLSNGDVELKISKEWNYQIAEATRKQFGILKKLMEREDVTGLVESTDAGREEALKDFWDYCEERQREERIIAEMKIKG